MKAGIKVQIGELDSSEYESNDVGWGEDMEDTVGQTGIVMMDSDDGIVRVTVGETYFYYFEKDLIELVPPISLDKIFEL